MASITLKGNSIETIGDLPSQGSEAPAFALVKDDMSEIKLEDYRGKKLILNIFPSIDTSTCAISVKTFNQKASEKDNVHVLNISRDLPFALKRFCAAEGIDKVDTASDFRGSFGEDYHLSFKTGPLKGLLSRSIIVLDENGKVAYTQQVQETTEEPDYDSALAAV